MNEIQILWVLLDWGRAWALSVTFPEININFENANVLIIERQDADVRGRKHLY